MGQIFYQRQIATLIRENQMLKKSSKQLSININQTYELISKFMSSTFPQLSIQDIQIIQKSEQINFHHFVKLIDYYETNLKELSYSPNVQRNIQVKSKDLLPLQQNTVSVKSQVSQISVMLKQIFEERSLMLSHQQSQIQKKKDQIKDLQKDLLELSGAQIKNLQQIKHLKEIIGQLEYELAQCHISKEKQLRIIRGQVSDKEFIIKQLMQEVKSVNLTCSRVIQGSQFGRS